MDKRSLWRSTPQVVFGLVLIVVGVLIFLDNFYLIDVHGYLPYWPVLVIAFGLSKLIQPGGRVNPLVGLILIFAGTAKLLDNLDVMYFDFWDYLPVVIVAIGLSMIWRTFTRQRPRDNMTTLPPDSDSMISGTAILSGFRRTSSSQNFRGGELTAIMGGCEIDLRQASMSGGEAVLDVFAFWGGIDLKVPLDWSIVTEGSPLMGGFDDKTRPPQGGSTKRLIIRGYAIMGGVQISN